MNDDVNKSKFRGWLEELAEQELHTRPFYNTQLRQDISRWREMSILPDELLRRYGTSHAKLHSQIAKGQKRLTMEVNTSVQRANIRAEKHSEEFFSATAMNSLVRESESSLDLAPLRSVYSSYSNVQLQQLQKRIEEERQQRQSRAKELAGGIYTAHTISDPNNFGKPGLLKEIDYLSAEQTGAVQRQAAINLELKRRAMVGQDPKSKEAMAYEYLERHKQRSFEQNVFQSQEIGGIRDYGREGLRSVRIGDEATRESEAQYKRLAEVMKQLETAVGEVNQKLQEERDILTENIQTIEKGQAAGGGRGGGKFLGVSAAGWGKATTIAEMISIGGDLIGKVGVDQRMQNLANKAGFAQLQNQQYDMYTAARRGDIAAQMAMGHWGAAQDFGGQIRTAASTNEIMSGLGGAIAKLGTGALMAGGATTATGSIVGIPVAGTLAAGAAYQVAGGISDIASTATSIVNGTKSAQATLAGTRLSMETTQAINAISARQIQSYRDFIVGGSAVARGLGSKANAFMGELSQGPLLGTMAQMGISPEEMVSMSQMGIQTMGSQFSTNQVLTARALESHGLGTMQENMQRQAVLAAGGSNNPQSSLLSVMTVAVAKGLDQASTLKALVDNTAGMAAQGAGIGLGIDTTKEVAASLTAQVSSTAVNKEVALQTAVSDKELARQFAGNASVSFSGMVNTSRIATTLGVSMESAIASQKIDSDTMKAIARMDEDKARDVLLQKGIVTKKGEAVNFATGSLGLNQLEILEAGGVGRAYQLDSVTLRDKINKMMAADKAVNKTTTAEDVWKSLEGDIQGKLGQTGTAADFKGGALGMIRAVMAENISVGDTNETLGKMKEGETTTFDKTERLRTGEARHAAEVAQQGMRGLEKIGPAVDILVESLKRFEEGGAKREEEYSTAAAKSATNFSISVDKFDGVVSRLETTVTNLAKQAGIAASPSVSPYNEQNTKVGSARTIGKPGRY